MSDPLGPMRQQQEQMRRQQEQMRKQQEQMRKMQEDARKRQMQGAWYEKQKQEQAAVAPMIDRFAEVERQAAELRHQRATGQLSESELKARLNDLMIQDASGIWWMVGTKSGEWYRSHGNAWVRAAPSTAGNLSSGASASAARPKRRYRLRALMTIPVGVLFSLVVAYMLSGLASAVVRNAGGQVLPLLVFFVVLVGGLVITVRQFNEYWSGR